MTAVTMDSLGAEELREQLSDYQFFKKEILPIQ
jgi:hypothetical protein